MPEAVSTTSAAASTSRARPTTKCAGRGIATPRVAARNCSPIGSLASATATSTFGRARCTHAADSMKRSASRADLGAPASGQHREQRRRRRQPERGPRGRAVDSERNRIRERMTDELRRDAVLGIELRLERQHAEHEIDGVADRLHATLAPGPDLRAHVLHRRNPGVLQALGERQVEVRRVDADEHVCGQRLGPFAELAADAQQARQMRQHLGQPHDRQLFSTEPGLAARRDHLRPGDADESRVRERAACSASMSPAPSVSPDCSPAASAIRNSPVTRALPRAQRARPREPCFNESRNIWSSG